MTQVSAAVKLIPTPPARVLNNMTKGGSAIGFGFGFATTPSTSIIVVVVVVLFFLCEKTKSGRGVRFL